MVLSGTTLAIFAIVAATGLIWTLTLSESANAWHSEFASKKECVDFVMDASGDSNTKAQDLCTKIIPH